MRAKSALGTRAKERRNVCLSRICFVLNPPSPGAPTIPFPSGRGGCDRQWFVSLCFFCHMSPRFRAPAASGQLVFSPHFMAIRMAASILRALRCTHTLGMIIYVAAAGGAIFVVQASRGARWSDQFVFCCLSCIFLLGAIHCQSSSLVGGVFSFSCSGGSFGHWRDCNTTKNDGGFCGGWVKATTRTSRMRTHAWATDYCCAWLGFRQDALYVT